jgi:hypothetical protein
LVGHGGDGVSLAERGDFDLGAGIDSDLFVGCGVELAADLGVEDFQIRFV